MKKMLLVAIIALLMIAGLVLVSCGANCPDKGKCEYDPAKPGNTNLCYLSFKDGIPNADIKQAETCLGTTTEPTKKIKCKC